MNFVMAGLSNFWTLLLQDSLIFRTMLLQDSLIFGPCYNLWEIRLNLLLFLHKSCNQCHHGLKTTATAILITDS